MNAHTLFTLGLLTATPSLVFAQAYPEPPLPAIAAVPVAPNTAKAPRAPNAPRPAVAVSVEAPAIAPLPETPQAPPAPKPAPAPQAAPAPAIAPGPPKPLGQMLNVQVEVTLSDSKGTPKTVVLTVADGEMGQNRTSSDLQMTPGGYKTFAFNADARPTIAGSKVRLYLSAEAQVPAADAKAGSATNVSSAATINLRQSQTLILNDGDSVEIARASDPVSDRAFVLSVKVKIQR